MNQEKLEEQKPYTVTGQVEEALGGQRFRVKLEQDVPSRYIDGVKKRGDLVVAYMAGKLKKNKINIIIGDRVEVVMDPYGRTHRITWRLK